jgi:hypothetical protein
LQQLAEDRVLDARALLNVQTWSGAYYLAGYAVECGLKSCVLAFLERTGAIFKDRKFQENCWTHEPEKLAKLAGLDAQLGATIGANPSFAGYWGVAKDWAETSRYEQKTQVEAESLYTAISDNADGVLQWIRTHW